MTAAESSVARIEAVRRVLEERLADPPSMEELAGTARLSPFHFHRLFRGITGETVRGFTRRLRLERAAHRLEHTDDDLLGIALDLGYGSNEAFTRAFRKHFGVAPSEYRRGVRAEELSRASDPSTAPVDVRIRERAPCTVACVRHVGPYSECGAAWRALMKWGWTKVVFGSRETFGLCHDDPDVVDPGHVRYDACMVVAPGTRTKRDVVLREVAGGHFAVAVHRGDHANVGTTYAGLFARIALHGADGRSWRLGDPPSLEVYLNDPRKVPPAQLETEIWMPVHPA